MVWSNAQGLGKTSAWAVARGQHGVITYAQLIALGYSRRAIEHRIRIGRLYCLYRGVYAVGRAELTDHGRWMAAVLAAGEGAVLSHLSAAALWGLRKTPARIDISVPANRHPRCPSLHIHRRTTLFPAHLTTHHRIPVTSPALTLIDLATLLSTDSLEAAINEADKHDHIDPEQLRATLTSFPPIPGTARLRAVLDHHTFTLTDSQLERAFLRIVKRAGLPKPQTQVMLNGFRVDFYWPELGLVVETDGQRYHRTPAQQTKDRRRDQAHTAAGLIALRFTRAQVGYDPAHVETILVATVNRTVKGLSRAA